MLPVWRLACKKAVEKNKKKLASYSYRAATTAHPCYIPVLGDSAGAGRIRLARAAKVSKQGAFAMKFSKKIKGYVLHILLYKNIWSENYASMVFFTSSSISSVSSLLLPSAYTRSSGSVPEARSIIQPPLSRWYFMPSIVSLRLKLYLPNFG